MTKEQKEKISKAMKSKFKNGHPSKGKKRGFGYWTGKKRGLMPQEWKDKIGAANKGKKRTEEAKKKMSKAQSGKTLNKNNNFKGKRAGYNAYHSWLYRNFGKADRCQNAECNGKCKKYEWAKLHGAKYEHKRENYIKLCVTCHRRYDKRIIQV